MVRGDREVNETKLANLLGANMVILRKDQKIYHKEVTKGAVNTYTTKNEHFLHLDNNQIPKLKGKNVLIAVVRYFGGIKLGASGLVRAYSNSASSAIDRADITDLVEGYLLKIEFDYEHTKAINAILKKYEIEKSFDEKIVYRFKVSVKEYNEIEILLKKYVNTISKKPILLSV